MPPPPFRTTGRSQAPAPRTQQGSILGLDKLAAQKSAEKQAALEAAGLAGGGRGSAKAGGGGRGALSFADLDSAPGGEGDGGDAGGGGGGQKESRCAPSFCFG